MRVKFLHRQRLALAMVILSATSALAEKNPVMLASGATSSSVVGYDEQLILSFNQNLPSIASNVTTVEQCGNDTIGPAYLVNGRSNTGYWYQAGVAWNWPASTTDFHSTFQGFYAIFEVFSSNGTSFYFGGRRGPLLHRLDQIHEKDLVMLKLSFAGSDTVLMSLHDWNSSATDQTTYSAFGATTFVGVSNAPTDSTGFFTGFMTEQYHVSPYYGDEQTVTYKESIFELSSAWMWIDEYPYPSRAPVLFNEATHVTYSNPFQLQNFTSNGAFEASSPHEFVTGRQSTGSTCAPFDYSHLILPAALGALVVILGLVLVWQRKQSIGRAPPESPPPSQGEQPPSPPAQIVHRSGCEPNSQGVGSD